MQKKPQALPAAQRFLIVEILTASLCNAACCDYAGCMGFSAGAALRFGWETFKRRPWFFIGSTFLIMLVSGLIDAFARGLDAAISGSADEPSLLGSVISLVGGTLINMGATAFYLAAHDNPDAVDLSALWHPRPFLKFLGASILLMLAIVAGVILLIVPGIIFALMFMFTTFIVIDREFGPIDAMKESRRITHGHKWKLLGFTLLLVLINLLGLAALVVGLLVSIPVSSLAFVYAYRLLGGKAEPRPVDAALAA